MKKSTIKRALGMVVALAMVPGIYGTALADEATINGKIPNPAPTSHYIGC